MYLLSVIEEPDKIDQKIIFAAALDSPITNIIYPEAPTTITISGWVLAGFSTSKISVVAEALEGEITDIPLTINRPDVLAIVLKDDSKSELVCGFSQSVIVSSKIKLYFKINDERYIWKNIIFERLPKKIIEASLTKWDAFLNTKNKIKSNPVEISEIELLIIKTCLQSTKICWNKEEFLTASDKNINKKYVDDFFSAIISENLAINLISTSMEHGKAQLVNPFSGRISYSSNSYFITNNINALMFQDEDEFFFLLQHATSADGLYFPDSNLILIQQHLTERSCLQAKQWLFENIEKVCVDMNSNHEFGGIVASQGRPYHFYYEVAPALEGIHESGLLHKIPSIYMLEGEDFLSIKSLYEIEVEEHVINADRVNELNTRLKQFLIKVGGLSNANKIQSFDKRLIFKLPQLLDAHTKGKIHAGRICFPLIWLGITGQKRAWCEQVEGSIELINELYKSFPGLGICFDGWTSPLNTTNRDKIESKNDQKIVEEIQAGISKSIPIFNLVGETSINKIGFAQAIDFFVANYSTGSMFVARFAKKPGIGHISNALNCSNHIHPSTIKIPSSFVTDVVSQVDFRADFVSYHIPPKVITSLAIKLMQDSLLVESRMLESGIAITER